MEEVASKGRKERWVGTRIESDRSEPGGEQVCRLRAHLVERLLHGLPRSGSHGRHRQRQVRFGHLTEGKSSQIATERRAWGDAAAVVSADGHRVAAEFMETRQCI